MGLQIRDPRRKWIAPLREAAERRGIKTHVIKSLQDVTPDDLLFIRPHADPKVLRVDKEIYGRAGHSIQDWRQVEYYDNKRAQAAEWGHWMPRTVITSDIRQALEYAETCSLPIVSKADVGASSYNVRVIEKRHKLIAHIEKIFRRGGITVDHCDSQGTKSIQNDYVILQDFIPHDVTYRVNRIGKQNAIFLRSNYPDRPVAQTGNTVPVYELNDEYADLLDYANRFFREAETDWCAVDILKCGDGWRVIETSLSWPWPSPGDCNNATFFPSGRKWIDMFEVMLDEWQNHAALRS